jgi:hypothetical protein
MELRVESTLFNSNGGGNGGSGYQGRQDQGEPRKPKGEEQPEEAAHLDSVDLQPNASRSQLHFLPSVPAPAIDFDALGDDIKGRVRYLILAMGHLERKLDRCTGSEVGSVLIA